MTSTTTTNKGKNELKLMIETSAAVPSAILVIGVGLILYKTIKKYCKNRKTINLNSETMEMESNDEIVIYSREQTMETIL